MAAVRRVEVSWHGALATGKGLIETSTSGVLGNLPVTWASRTEEANGRTSPEELLAAAHASCYAMAFSSELGKNHTPPESLDVSATVTFDKVDGGFRVVSSALTVRGAVPGINADAFQKIAEQAKDGCPISQALDDSVRLSVEATLAQTV